MGLLSGLRLIEIGDWAAWGTKLLADLGAEVIIVEPPGGSPARRNGPHDRQTGASLSFAYFNTNKRSVILDLERPADRDRFRALTETADALVESCPPGYLAERGLGPADLAAIHPALLSLSVAPFGQTGPRRDWPADDATIWALGGPMALCGLPGRPPLQPPYDPAFITSGTYAALAVLAGLAERRRSGLGQAIDLSVFEAAASLAEAVLFFYQYGGENPIRMGTEHPATVPLRAFTAKDGAVYLIALSDAQWFALIDWIDETADASALRDPHYLDQTRRTYDREVIHEIVARWAAGLTVETMVREGQRRRIPVARVNSPAGVVEDEHLAARGFWADVPRPDGGPPIRFAGAPVRLPDGCWSIDRLAPEPGADQSILETRAPRPPVAPALSGERALPLAGLRVLDFTWVWAGPFATSLLADLGADVIKVESIGQGDYNRHAPPFAGELPDLELAGAHLCFNRSKRSIAVNVRHPDGLALIRRLVRASDVLIENFSAGTLERIGLGEEILRAERPDLILVRLSGFGQAGLYRQYVSFAPLLHGMSGMTHLTGYAEDGALTGPGVALSDFFGGLFGAFSVLAGVEGRARDGVGRTVDVGQFETSVSTLGPFLLDYLVNGHDAGPSGLAAPYQPWVLRFVLPTAGDDRWIALSLSDDAAWERLIGLPETPAALRDPAYRTAAGRSAGRAAIDRALAAWTAEQKPHDLMDRWLAAGLAAGVVQIGPDLLADPQLAARGYWVERTHVRAGRLTLPTIPIRFAATPAQVRHPGPLLGQDTDTVLAEIAGLDAAEIDRLRSAGAIG